MPRFKGIPSLVVDPGPMPNGAIIMPRSTKCWWMIHMTMMYAYPKLADDIALALLENQRKFYEDKLNQKSYAVPAVAGVLGFLLGLGASLYIYAKVK
jgi:hypothetical protein